MLIGGILKRTGTRSKLRASSLRIYYRMASRYLAIMLGVPEPKVYGLMLTNLYYLQWYVQHSVCLTELC